MPIITLTTDFGLQDGFAGVLKGVIWSICPQAQIADITHMVAAQNVLEGAYALGRAYAVFPAGTVHVAIVDPGVGTQRRPLALHLDEYFFVGPDNGLFTPMLEQAEKGGGPVECFTLDKPEYWLAQVSRTFHGRDIFAPVAAHLARGVLLAELGTAIDDPLRLELLRPEKTATGWHAHVTVADVFGNLTTDLPAVEIAGRQGVSFRLAGREVRGLVETYGQAAAGELVALVDSENFVEIAVVNGSAARVLGAHVGDTVEVVYPS